jgi:hypothetical protein
MRPPRKIRHEFVDLAPKALEEGVLYVSIEYAGAVHNCFCGCGNKVSTPIAPTGWRLTFDGDTVSLWPSVGNWDLPCRSHYVIERDMARWAGAMTREEIAAGRAADRRQEAAYYGQAPGTAAPASPQTEAPPPAKKRSFWSWLLGGSS